MNQINPNWPTPHDISQTDQWGEPLRAGLDDVEAQGNANDLRIGTLESQVAALGSGGGTSGVTTVNGRSGAVVLSKTDVNLGAADNTSDLNKPVSTAQQAALNTKVTVPTGGTDGQVIIKNSSAPGGHAYATITSGGGGGSSSDVFAPAPLGGTNKDDTNIISAITANPGKIVKLQPGAVYLVNSLALPSNTYLDLNGSELRQNNPTGVGGGGAAVRNSNYTEDITANTNITIENGKISCGTASQARPVSFQGVNKLRMRNIIIEKRSDATFADFMLSINCVDDFEVRGLRITGGTLVGEDGIHLKACTNGVVSDFYVDAGDDALVLVHQFAAKRETSNIAITNGVLRSTDAHIVRIGVYSGETFPIRRITMSNIVGDFAPLNGGEGVKIHDDTATGMVRDIVWDGGNLDLANQTANSGFICNNIVFSSFTNIRVKNAHNNAFQLNNCSDLTFDDCYGDQQTGVPANSLFSLVSSSRITMTACRVIGGTNHGFVFGGTTHCSDITMIACRASGAVGASFRLSAVDGIRMLGCVSTGSTNAISCDTAIPPTGVVLVGGSYTGSTSTIATNLPNDTVRVANAGLADANVSTGLFASTTAPASPVLNQVWVDAN